MYSRVPSLGREVRHVGEVRDTTKDTRTPQRLTFFSLSLFHKERAQSTIGGLEVTTEPSQTSWSTIHSPDASGRL